MSSLLANNDSYNRYIVYILIDFILPAMVALIGLSIGYMQCDSSFNRSS